MENEDLLKKMIAAWFLDAKELTMEQRMAAVLAQVRKHDRRKDAEHR